MDDMNQSGFLGVSEPDQGFDTIKYLGRLGFVIPDASQPDSNQNCKLSPASDFSAVDRQYMIQNEQIVCCNRWKNEQPRPFPFYLQNGRWYVNGTSSNPLGNIDLGKFEIIRIILISEDLTKLRESSFLIDYCYGETLTHRIAILSCNDFNKLNMTKAFPWIDPQIEKLMSILIFDLIITSVWHIFIPPKHSGWSIAINGVLFHAQGFEYIDMLRDYYPDGCSRRIYLEDKMKVFPKDYLNQDDLPWQVTIANLLRLSSLLLSFFREESIELKQMFLLHCSDRVTADQCVALLKK